MAARGSKFVMTGSSATVYYAWSLGDLGILKTFDLGPSGYSKVGCLSTTFGDPEVNVYKKCFMQSTPPDSKPAAARVQIGEGGVLPHEGWQRRRTLFRFAGAQSLYGLCVPPATRVDRSTGRLHRPLIGA